MFTTKLPSGATARVPFTRLARLIAGAALTLGAACADVGSEGEESAGDEAADVELQGKTAALTTDYQGVWTPIFSADTFKCLFAASNQANSRAEAWGCVWGKSDQLFRLGQDRTLRQGPPGNQRCLELVSFVSGSQVLLSSCNGTSRQRWVFTASNEIRTVDANLCLTPFGTIDGRPVLAETCHGGQSQKWARSPSVLKKWNTGTCITNASGSGSYETGENAVVGPCNDPHALWYVPTGPNTIAIQHSSGKCLDVKWAGTANHTQLHWWDCNGGSAQQWESRDDGSLRNPASGRCLDLPWNNPSWGSVYQIYDCKSGEPAQKFATAPW